MIRAVWTLGVVCAVALSTWPMLAGEGDRDRKSPSPQDVAKAVLKVYQAKDAAAVMRLGTSRMREKADALAEEIARQGENHPIFRRSVFSGWRWRAVQAWDGEVGPVRFPDPNAAWVPFGEADDPQSVIVVVLVREEGAWCFEEVLSLRSDKFEGAAGTVTPQTQPSLPHTSDAYPRDGRP